MKSLLKNILVIILGWQVRRLRRRYDFKIVGVAGSVGKTSTKLAIAKVLAGQKRVRFQEGNYNDLVSVPLTIFGHKMPSLLNIFGWLIILIKNEFKIWFLYPYDFVVVELGTDGPGQISRFRKYLHLDLSVITAVSSEHMEFFKTMEAVSEEEWSVRYFSDVCLVNKDLCKTVPHNLSHQKLIFYGKDFGSVYKIENVLNTKNGFSFDICFEGKKIIELSYPAVSEVELYSICAAVIVSEIFKLNREKTKESIKGIESFSGRMQKLRGIKDSVIIDDTYNSSPEALKNALDSLYKFQAEQRIAILGMMNELGETSEEEHKRAGRYCDPKFLDLLVTIGGDANRFLASEAEKNGCKVYRADDALMAGLFVKDNVQKGAVILAKGSQNGVFAEEALKPLLLDKADSSKLVRQEESWMKKKTFITNISN